MNFTNICFEVYRDMRSQIVLIQRMPLQHRTVLIKCCQAQFIPSVDSRIPLALMIRNLPPFVNWSYSEAVIQSGKDMLHFFQNFSSFQDPVSCAIILDLCRSLPLQPFEIIEAKEKGWKKEAVKIEERSGNLKINWDPIFDDTKHHEQMVLGVRPNPKMARYFYQSLCRWADKLHGTTLYPRATRKHMSRSTLREFCAEARMSSINTPIWSQVDWMRYYFRTGIRVGGITEMRQRWYTSGAKPRTYFAQGGKPYSVSRHLQDPFSALVNSNTITNHISRLQPVRLVIRSDQRLRIYDLETFTSNMEEQRSFNKGLANFVGKRGVEVFLVDEREGLIVRDLGDLLWEYWEECVWYPEVSYERVPDVDEENWETDHGKASMLGIFGNLMCCTFGHGAVVAQVVESDAELNVAGDDGQVAEDDEWEEEVDLCICAVGKYERSKTFRSDEEGCICLKRPLIQSGTIIQHLPLVVPPSMTVAAHYLWGLTDPRYSFHNFPTHNGALSIVGKDWMRCLRSAHRVQWRLSDDHLDRLCNAFNSFSRLVFDVQPYDGRLQHCGDNFFWPCRVSTDELREEDPLKTLVRNRYRGAVSVLKKEYLDVVELSSKDQGDTFQSNSSRQLVLLERLGVLEKEDVEIQYSASKGFHMLFDSLTTRIPQVYQYTVVAPIPRHLVYL